MFVFILVKMGLSLSLLRVDLSWYRSEAKKLTISTSEMETVKKTFMNYQVRISKR